MPYKKYGSDEKYKMCRYKLKIFRYQQNPLKKQAWFKYRIQTTYIQLHVSTLWRIIWLFCCGKRITSL